jgi:ADP-ribose pyrophosphatase YjhB (NUDIX family)
LPKGKPKPRSVSRTATARDVAESLGLSVEVVRDAAIAGCPHTKRRGPQGNLYNVSEFAAWRKSRGLTGKPGRPVLTGDEDIDEAKRRKELAMAENWELRNAVHRRELVPVSEVERLGAEVFRMLSSKLQGLPAAMVPRLEGRAPHEQMAILTDGLRAIVEQFKADLVSVGDRIAVAPPAEAE